MTKLYLFTFFIVYFSLGHMAEFIGVSTINKMGRKMVHSITNALGV